MRDKKEINNPKNIFKEQDDLVVPGGKMPVEKEELASIRPSRISSIVPDDMNRDNIYVGKQHGLHSVKPGVDSRRKRSLSDAVYLPAGRHLLSVLEPEQVVTEKA